MRDEVAFDRRTFLRLSAILGLSRISYVNEPADALRPDAPPLPEEAADALRPEVIGTHEQQKAELFRRVQEAWRDQQSALNKLWEGLEQRFLQLVDKQISKRAPGDVANFKFEWGRAEKESGIRPETAVDQDKTFALYKEYDVVLSKWETKYEIQQNGGADSGLLFQSYPGISARRREVEQRHKALLMTGEDGRIVGLFPDELQRNPELTPQEYIRMLANILKSPADLAMLFHHFMRYAHDPPDNEPDKQREGHFPNRTGDYWHTWIETISRVKDGKMFGDCEDIALLAREILTLWGKKPIAMLLPAHCTCVWIERRSEKYVAFDIGTSGLWSGQLPIVAPHHAAEISKDPLEEGGACPTPACALQQVVHKYTADSPDDYKEWDVTQKGIDHIAEVPRPFPASDVQLKDLTAHLSPEELESYATGFRTDISAPPVPTE